MFASPLRADGWWVMPASLRDGSEVDFHTGNSPVRWEKPEEVAGTFSTPRVMKWLTYVWTPEHRDKIAGYAAWLRRDWNGRHDASRQVEAMRVHYMLEETSPENQPPLRGDLLIYEWNAAGGERIIPYAESLRSIESAREPAEGGSKP
jgi:hypothetical protein